MAMEASLGMDGGVQDTGAEDIQTVTETAPIVRYVNLLILQALNERASDVHIEPTETDLRIRYRIDGVLHDVSTGPKTIAAAVTTRLKVMADMNIAEHRVPQDGRISLNVGAKGIDLRMATLPTIYGEKIVMRVLDKSSVVLGFTDLGFDAGCSSGTRVCTASRTARSWSAGPTGSGKSTTLYTTLTALNSPEKNIITVEDPVEVPLKGVNQVQLNVKAGLTFAGALRRSCARTPTSSWSGRSGTRRRPRSPSRPHSPGTWCSPPSTRTAPRPRRCGSSRWGSSPSWSRRPSPASSPSVSPVACACTASSPMSRPRRTSAPPAGPSRRSRRPASLHEAYRSAGCSACATTGYRGRLALAELMSMTEEVERMIIEGGSVEEIHRLAVSQGMVALRTAGLRKAIEGETTLEEILRVVA